MTKIVFILFGVILFVYLVLPGPRSIGDFQPLPNSLKSTLSGDTIQVPNVSAYFSNNYRAFVTEFYRKNMQMDTWFPFLPIRINYPPETAFQYIKDQTQSTYLEEYVYPLRESLFVNGLEPFTEDGQQRYSSATYFEQDGMQFQTKVTLRYYPSPIWVRIVVWAGLMTSVWGIWRLGKGIVLNG